ncbi:MAG: DUF3820 family protein [Crocinitomicaceae bacterium]|jgi:uncharacterized protein (DUF3820 family)|nr:DUF3820 family protein [Crocinitomicaceae bacterium]
MSEEHELVQVANMRMPFGKYKGEYLVKLPEPYLIWMQNQGWPPGKLGRQLALMLEIKQNSLEKLIYPLMKK